jgi:putative ABC transport system permease protein
MKFALRQLIKNPGFTLIALVTLALGIGASTTAFTVLNRLLLQSLPFTHPDRLVQIWGSSPKGEHLGQTPADYFDIREQSTVFEHVAAYYMSPYASLAEPGQPAQQAVSMPVAADFFPVFGIAPVMGRAFTPEEEARHEPVAILSHAYWQKHFDGSPQVLGKTLRLDGKVVSIVGVMSPIFDDPMIWNGSVDLWSLDPTDVNRHYRDGNWYWIAARLKPGITLQQAQAELDTIALKLAHDYPKTNTQLRFKVEALPADSMGDLGHNITWLIMDLSLVVLLIVCVNLANLQIVRTTGRSREIAVRLAMGASRGQLIRLLLTESLLLSLAGGVLGLLVARWSNSYIASYWELTMPMDLRVLFFALAISTITGAGFGILPAWMAVRADVNSVLKQGGRGTTSDRSRHRLRNGLIVVELALALTLLTGAGYFVRGIQRIAHRELGWRQDNILIGTFSLAHDRYGELGDNRSVVFGEQFQKDLLALPGVDQAVLGRGTPAWGYGAGGGFLIEGRSPPPAGKEPIAFTEAVTPGYFATYGLPLVRGRDFTPADRPGAPAVVIINQTMANKFWPGENPLGKRIGGTDPANPNWSEIVGVVPDIIAAGDLGPPQPHDQIYRPWAQNSHRFITFTLHSTKDPRVLKDSVRRVLAKVEPDVAIPYLVTIEELLASNLSGFALVRRMLLEIAALGLLLSGLGIYGVIANLAAERTQEIGVRMALGAQPGDVLRLFLRNGFRLALLGTAIGLLCSFGLMHLLNRTMAVVPGNDPWVVITVAVLLFGVALLASWLPARRATRISPMIALRAE